MHCSSPHVTLLVEYLVEGVDNGFVGFRLNLADVTTLFGASVERCIKHTTIGVVKVQRKRGDCCFISCVDITATAIHDDKVLADCVDNIVEKLILIKALVLQGIEGIEIRVVVRAHGLRKNFNVEVLNLLLPYRVSNCHFYPFQR